jgi:hypothetical protein
VSANPTSIVASSGGTTSTITVTARDQFGNPIQGVAVTLAATGTGNTVTDPLVATDLSGVATGSFSSTKAEGKAISATAGGVPITQAAAVTVTASTAVSPSLSTVSLGTSSIEASSGAITTTVTVTARDQFGNPIPNATVALAATGTGNTVIDPAAATDNNGVAIGTISSTKAEDKTVSATASSVTIAQQPVLTVTHAAATQITFTQQPTAGTTLTDLSPAFIVTLLDPFGNIATGHVGSVTMTIETDASVLQNAQLTGTNPVTVTGGTATFADLRLDQLGLGYMLRATAGGLFTISAAINIL